MDEVRVDEVVVLPDEARSAAGAAEDTWRWTVTPTILLGAAVPFHPVPGAAGLVALFGGVAVLRRANVRSALATSAPSRQPARWVVTRERLRVEDPTSVVDVDWSAVERVVERPTVLDVRLRDGRRRLLPHRCLQGLDRHRILTWLREAGVTVRRPRAGD